MIQDIIVLLIILSAVAYAIYGVVKAIITKDDALCGDCFACGIPELTKQKNIKKHENTRTSSKGTIPQLRHSRNT